MDNLGEIQNVIAYALGFGIGVIVGMRIEEKLAIGYITVNVISSNPDIPFTRKLRAKGYGVTSWYAYGMDGDRLALQVLTPRRYELMLYEAVKEIDPKAFIIAYEPRQIHGGFWVKKVKGVDYNVKKKKYRVSDFDSIDVCLDQMAKDGYRPIRRMEKPVFEEKKNGERVPISQEIIFEAIEK